VRNSLASDEESACVTETEDLEVYIYVGTISQAVGIYVQKKRSDGRESTCNFLCSYEIRVFFF
jgi:hypothetical protein